MSDSLNLVEEKLQIVSDVCILFVTDFDVTLMLFLGFSSVSQFS